MYHRYRRRDRLHRVAMTNEVLHHYGLRLSDWSASKYVLRDKKGRSEHVQDLGALWARVAEALRTVARTAKKPGGGVLWAKKK